MDFYYIRQKLGARDCKFYKHKTRALSRLGGNFNRLGLIRAQYPKAQAQLRLEKSGLVPSLAGIPKNRKNMAEERDLIGSVSSFSFLTS